MANNQYVNKVAYAGQTLMDLTGDTVTPSKVLNGETFHDRSGAPQQGSIITHNVYDGLDSTSADDALSAKQGKKLYNLVESFTNDDGQIKSVGDANFNTLTSSGLYFVQGSSSNAPYNSFYGYVEVFASKYNGYLFQQAYNTSGDAQYMRTRGSNNAWSSWFSLTGQIANVNSSITSINGSITSINGSITNINNKIAESSTAVSLASGITSVLNYVYKFGKVVTIYLAASKTAWSEGTVVGNVPSGYRPAWPFIFEAVSYGMPSDNLQISILEDGDIKIWNKGTQASGNIYICCTYVIP